MTIRIKGLLQFLGAGLGFALAIYWFMNQRAANPNYSLPGGSLGLIALVAPGGFSLAGLIQFVSGVAFSELSDKWNALKGWQRGVFGVLIFAGVLGLLFGGFAFYVLVLSGN